MKTSLLFTLLFISLNVYCQTNTITITDDDLTDEDYFWQSDNIYLLNGLVYLEGGSLTIEPGTVIKAKRNPTNGDETSALIITQNAQIFAVGEYMNPIIFTSEIDDIDNPFDLFHNQSGLWGGIVILGQGLVPDQNGNPVSRKIDFLPDDNRNVFGGVNDNDEKGEMKFVSIRYAGARVNDTALPAMTFAGLARSSSLRASEDFSFELSDYDFQYIEVHASAGDGFRFESGTVNIKNLASSFTRGHSFNLRGGYAGKGQFWFAIDSDDKSGYSLYVDGELTNPTLFNMTFLGAGPLSNYDKGIIFKNSAKGTMGMSIIGEMPIQSIEIEDIQGDNDSWNHFIQEELVFVSNHLTNLPNGINISDLFKPSNNGDDSSADEFEDMLVSKRNEIKMDLINSISRTDNSMLDPEVELEDFIPFEDLESYPFDDFFVSTLGLPCEGRGAFIEVGAWWLRYWSGLEQEQYLRHPCVEIIYDRLRFDGIDPFALRYECKEVQDSVLDLFYDCYNSQCAFLNQELAVAMRMRRKKKRKKSINDYCYSEEWSYTIIETAGLFSPLLPEEVGFNFTVLDSFELILETEIVDTDIPEFSFERCDFCPNEVSLEPIDCDTSWIVNDSHEYTQEEERIINHSWTITDFCENVVKVNRVEYEDADICALAPIRLVGDTCMTSTVSTFKSTLEMVDLPSSSCSQSISDAADIWFEINTEDLSNIGIQVLRESGSSLTDAFVEIYKNSCDNLDLMNCFDLDDKAFEISTLNEKDLRVRIVSSINLNKQGSLDICFYSERTSTSTAEEFSEQSITLYPNPTHNILQIEINEQWPVMTLEIFDINGTRIKSSTFQNANGKIQIEIRELPSGVYFLSLQNKERKSISKFYK